MAFEQDRDTLAAAAAAAVLGAAQHRVAGVGGDVQRAHRGQPVVQFQGTKQILRPLW